MLFIFAFLDVGPPRTLDESLFIGLIEQFLIVIEVEHQATKRDYNDAAHLFAVLDGLEFVKHRVFYQKEQ